MMASSVRSSSSTNRLTSEDDGTSTISPSEYQCATSDSSSSGSNNVLDDTDSGLIEVNPALLEDDADSDYFTGGASGTTSLFSSAYNYEFENGRRYHSFRSGKYFMPNDELEQERLDIMHYVNLCMLDGRMCVSPVEKKVGMKVLDVGTGTGIWAIDFADAHPDASVVGVDLSPIQPLSIPTNLRFEIDDVESEWTYPDADFDFIHVRHLALSIQDWPHLLSQAFRCLKPGGYLELCEAPCKFYSDDNSLPNDSAIDKFTTHFNSFCDQQGLIYSDVMRLKELMIQAGFTDITITKRKMPMAPWPVDEKLRHWGELLHAQRKLSGLEAHCLALFTRVGGMSVEEARKVVNEADAEIVRKDVHVYVMQYWFSGRKPRRRRGMERVDE